MKTTITRALSAAVFSALTSATAFAAERDISGTYAMSGTSLRPNSTAYAGVCKLVKAATVYKVNCINTGSADKYAGKGILTGELFSLYLGEYLVVYNLKPDGELDGKWAHARSDDFGKEVLKPKKAATMKK